MGATASQATHLPRSQPADGLAQGAGCGRDNNPKGKGSWADQEPQPPRAGVSRISRPGALASSAGLT